MKFSLERIVPDTEYCGPHTKIYLEHSARYEFTRKFVAGKKVLDVACGTGYGSKILHNCGASEVYGGDISKEAIIYAQKKFSNSFINFHVVDVSRLPFPENSFDCVISFETIEHITKYKEVIKDFHRILKKNGLLIISTPNKDITSKGSDKAENIFHVKEFTKEEFLQLLGQYFPDVTLFSQLLVVNIGIFRKIIRHLVYSIINLDRFRIHTKIFKEATYVSVGNLIDNTDRQYAPVPYQNGSRPLVFVAVCRKN